MKPGALLLLLAVAASQVDLSHMSQSSVDVGSADISSCPISFFGKGYSRVFVTLNSDSSLEFCFGDDPSKDCLKVAHGGNVSSLDVNVFQSVNGPGSVPYTNVESIQSTSQCYVKMEWVLYNFGLQTVMSVTSYPGFTDTHLRLSAFVGGQFVKTWVESANDVSTTVFLDISGCRVSGVGFDVGTENHLATEICATVSCSASALVSFVPSCGPDEVCLGGNKCGTEGSVCTVTGSTVIDFYDRVHSVPNRCVYSLMKASSEFEIRAGFQERRRTDVSFLDHLTIHLQASEIYLGQGGTVHDGAQTLTLNATAQLVHGVELSKDHTGVTAKIPAFNVTVFFDGNTAHLLRPDVDVNGLCGRTVDPSDALQLNGSTPAECSTQHPDIFDSTIDCSRSTEHCNLTMQAPFTACHDFVQPDGFFTACTNTLCSYPSVDGLKCQFLEAYAKACYLQANITLEDWRSTAGCPAGPQPCRDQYCSDHEFCGGMLDGTHRCMCRALFASEYKPTDALGEPTVCTLNSATLTLAGCLMADKGIDYSNLHLRDPDCKGHMDDKTHMMTFSFSSSHPCGMEVLTNNSQVIHKNTIMAKNRSMEVITRHDQVEIDFSCVYQKPEIQSLSFKIKDSSVVQQIVSGVWNYTLMMNVYADPGLMSLVAPTTEIHLNQKLWLELKTEGLDSNIVTIVTDSCWATEQPSPDSTPRYNLIGSGCPIDQTVTMVGNGEGTSNVFSFNMFEFYGSSTDVYLHCQTELCPTENQSCAPPCGGGGSRRRRYSRSKYANGKQARITVTWTN